MANKRHFEVSRSTSALQLESVRMSSQEESTRDNKKKGAESSSSGDSHRSRRREQRCRDSSISSRTRAKTKNGIHVFDEITLRGGGRKQRGGQGEKNAEKKSTKSAVVHNPYPTPSSSSAEADPSVPVSGGRHVRSTTVCQRADTPSSLKCCRNLSGAEYSRADAVNANASSSSDSVDNVGEEQSDERGGDDDDDDNSNRREEEVGRSHDDDEACDERVDGRKCVDVDCLELSMEGGDNDVNRDSARAHHPGSSRSSTSDLASDGDCSVAVHVHHPSSTHNLKAGSKRRLLGTDEDASPPKKWYSANTSNQAKLCAPENGLGSVSSLTRHQNSSQENCTDRQQWLDTFKLWSNAERVMALDDLIAHCELPQVRHMMQMLEPHFQRDFISLLPKELALYVLSFLKPKDLLKAAQTCRYWHVLCEDNLLWREKCMEEGVNEKLVFGSRAHRKTNLQKHYKALYLRQSGIENRWRTGASQSPLILRAHDDHVITCLEFCGQRIVSGSDDNTLKVWSAVTGKCLQTLVGHTGGVWSSQMAGNTIISGSTDRSLKIWNADTGVCKHTLYGHSSTVRCMSLYDKKVVSGSRDATMRVWHIETGHCLHVLKGHVAAVRCVQYNGKYVVSGAYDYSVRIWNPETETCLHVLQGHTNRVYSLQFDGVHIVSGSLDTSIRVWRVDSGQCMHTLVGHQSLTSGLELKDNVLVSGNADSTVKVWDYTTGQCLQTLTGPNKHQSAVTCLQFNKKFVVTSSDDGTVKIWDLHTGEFLRNLVTLPSGGSGGVVWRLRCSNTKLVCAVGSRNGTEETKLMVLDFDVEAAKRTA